MKTLLGGLAVIALASATALASPSLAQSNDSNSAGAQVQTKGGADQGNMQTGGALGGKGMGASDCDVTPGPDCPKPGVNTRKRASGENGAMQKSGGDASSSDNSGVTSKGSSTVTQQTDQGTQTQQNNKMAPAAGSKSNAKSTTENNNSAKSNASSTSSSTTNVNVTVQQKTQIRQEIKTVHVAPVAHVNFNISVGVAVPHTIHLEPLPASVVHLVPAYEGFLFFLLADGRIVIVDPHTLEIVLILD